VRSAALDKWPKSDNSTRKEDVSKETWATNAALSKRGLRKRSAVTAVTAPANTIRLNPNHSYGSDSNPSFPTYSEQVLLSVNIKTFVSVLKNRCHIQNMSIFVCFSERLQE